MKGIVAGLLVMSMLGLTGCEILDKYFPKESIVAGADKAHITVYKGDKSFTYNCDIDIPTQKFTNCVEVK